MNRFGPHAADLQLMYRVQHRKIHSILIYISADYLHWRHLRDALNSLSLFLAPTSRRFGRQSTYTMASPLLRSRLIRKIAVNMSLHRRGHYRPLPTAHAVPTMSGERLKPLAQASTTTHAHESPQILTTVRSMLSNQSTAKRMERSAMYSLKPTACNQMQFSSSMQRWVPGTCEHARTTRTE